MKRRIRLSESQLKRVIRKSVMHILKEGNIHQRNVDLDDELDFDSYNDYKNAVAQNRMWDGEDEDNRGYTVDDGDMDQLHVFTPSEEWEDENEDNFMGGRGDDFEDTESLREHVTEEAVSICDGIVEQANKLIDQINSDNEGYFNSATGFQAQYTRHGGKRATANILYGNIDIRCDSYLPRYRISLIDNSNGEYKEKFGRSGIIGHNRFRTEGGGFLAAVIRAVFEDTVHYNGKVEDYPTLQSIVSNNNELLMALNKAYESVADVRDALNENGYGSFTDLLGRTAALEESRISRIVRESVSKAVRNSRR